MDQPTIYAKTVCIKCSWHNGASTADPWHDHHCLHVEFQKHQEQDPVTGKIAFTGKNDLGQSYFCDDKHPYCRDHNHGNCEHFESKQESRNEL